MKTTTITRYYIYNKNGKNMRAVDSEAEAKAIVEKNAKRGWTYNAHTWTQEADTPWWAMAGYNADPTAVKYDADRF